MAEADPAGVGPAANTEGSAEPPKIDSDSSLTGLHNDRGRADRLWSHLLHLDGEFIQRGNLYLVGESMLLVAYSAILSRGPTGPDNAAALAWIARVIACFGAFLAIIWCYVNVGWWSYFRHVRRRVLEAVPDYRETVARTPRTMFGHDALTAFVVPGVTVMVWLILLLLV